MSVPDFQSFMLPVLNLAADGNEHAVAEFREKLADAMGISVADQEDLLPSGTMTRYQNRIYWSVVYLCKAGALRRPRRGVVQITERGRSLLAEQPGKITIGLLNRFPEFVEFHQPRKSNGERIDLDGDSIITSPQTPEERLESGYQELRNALAIEVLELVKRAPADFFERLVVTLLVAMGYGGSISDAGRAVGKSGDGGIDGIIKEDKLGLDNVYIQAKRYTEQSVGSKVVREFIGSLTVHRARKGVLMTTSTFTPDALASVRNLDQRIVLIDGQQLAGLMIEHNVGVATSKVYELKKIDQDFFDGE
jgi:restriction system protein